MARSENLKLLLRCPAKTSAAVQRDLRSLPVLKTGESLDAVLDDLQTPSEVLLSWICSEFGNQFISAPVDLKIPGFPGSVHQFFVAEQTPALEAAFNAHLEADSSHSIVLFHGTNLMNLRSILRTGFIPSAHLASVWMADDPATSYPFAAKGLNVVTAFVRNPYNNVGILLGCEVSGHGRAFSSVSEYAGTGADYRIHVVAKLKSIIVRYIFVLTAVDVATGGYPSYSASSRADVEPGTATAFAKFNPVWRNLN